jgi:hypothetical protein
VSSAAWAASRGLMPWRAPGQWPRRLVEPAVIQPLFCVCMY